MQYSLSRFSIVCTSLCGQSVAKAGAVGLVRQLLAAFLNLAKFIAACELKGRFEMLIQE